MNTDQAGSLSAQNSCHGLLFADEGGDEILESGAVPLTRQSTRKSNTTGAMTRNAAAARGLPRCPARYDIGKKPGRERLDNMAMSATEQNQDTFSVKSEETDSPTSPTLPHFGLHRSPPRRRIPRPPRQPTSCQSHATPSSLSSLLRASSSPVRQRSPPKRQQQRHTSHSQHASSASQSPERRLVVPCLQSTPSFCTVPRLPWSQAEDSLTSSPREPEGPPFMRSIWLYEREARRENPNVPPILSPALSVSADVASSADEEGRAPPPFFDPVPPAFRALFDALGKQGEENQETGAARTGRNRPDTQTHKITCAAAADTGPHAPVLAHFANFSDQNFPPVGSAAVTRGSALPGVCIVTGADTTPSLGTDTGGHGVSTGTVSGTAPNLPFSLENPSSTHGASTDTGEMATSCLENYPEQHDAITGTGEDISVSSSDNLSAQHGMRSVLRTSNRHMTSLSPRQQPSVNVLRENHTSPLFLPRPCIVGPHNTSPSSARRTHLVVDCGARASPRTTRITPDTRTTTRHSCAGETTGAMTAIGQTALATPPPSGELSYFLGKDAGCGASSLWGIPSLFSGKHQSSIGNGGGFWSFPQCPSTRSTPHVFGTHNGDSSMRAALFKDNAVASHQKNFPRTGSAAAVGWHPSAPSACRQAFLGVSNMSYASCGLLIRSTGRAPETSNLALVRGSVIKEVSPDHNVPMDLPKDQEITFLSEQSIVENSRLPECNSPMNLTKDQKMPFLSEQSIVENSRLPECNSPMNLTKDQEMPFLSEQSIVENSRLPECNSPMNLTKDQEIPPLSEQSMMINRQAPDHSVPMDLPKDQEIPPLLSKQSMVENSGPPQKNSPIVSMKEETIPSLKQTLLENWQRRECNVPMVVTKEQKMSPLSSKQSLVAHRQSLKCNAPIVSTKEEETLSKQALVTKVGCSQRTAPMDVTTKQDITPLSSKQSMMGNRQLPERSVPVVSTEVENAFSSKRSAAENRRSPEGRTSMLSPKKRELFSSEQCIVANRQYQEHDVSVVSMEEETAFSSKRSAAENWRSPERRTWMFSPRKRELFSPEQCIVPNRQYREHDVPVVSTEGENAFSSKRSVVLNRRSPVRRTSIFSPKKRELFSSEQCIVANRKYREHDVPVVSTEGENAFSSKRSVVLNRRSPERRTSIFSPKKRELFSSEQSIVANRQYRGHDVSAVSTVEQEMLPFSWMQSIVENRRSPGRNVLVVSAKEENALSSKQAFVQSNRSPQRNAPTDLATEQELPSFSVMQAIPENSRSPRRNVSVVSTKAENVLSSKQAFVKSSQPAQHNVQMDLPTEQELPSFSVMQAIPENGWSPEWNVSVLLPTEQENASCSLMQAIDIDSRESSMRSSSIPIARKKDMVSSSTDSSRKNSAFSDCYTASCWTQQYFAGNGISCGRTAPAVPTTEDTASLTRTGADNCVLSDGFTWISITPTTDTVPSSMQQPSPAGESSTSSVKRMKKAASCLTRAENSVYPEHNEPISVAKTTKTSPCSMHTLVFPEYQASVPRIGQNLENDICDHNTASMSRTSAFESTSLPSTRTSGLNTPIQERDGAPCRGNNVACIASNSRSSNSYRNVEGITLPASPRRAGSPRRLYNQASVSWMRQITAQAHTDAFTQNDARSTPGDPGVNSCLEIDAGDDDAARATARRHERRECSSSSPFNWRPRKSVIHEAVTPLYGALLTSGCEPGDDIRSPPSDSFLAWRDAMGAARSLCEEPDFPSPCSRGHPARAIEMMGENGDVDGECARESGDNEHDEYDDVEAVRRGRDTRSGRRCDDAKTTMYWPANVVNRKRTSVTAEEFLETTYKRLSKLESDRLRCLSEVRQERIMAERAQLKNPEISRKSKQLSSAWGDRAPVYLRADHECAMKDWRLRRKVEEKRNVEMAQLRDKPSILARSRYNTDAHAENTGGPWSIEQLIAWDAKRKRKLVDKRKARKNAEIDGLNFQPEICARSRQMCYEHFGGSTKDVFQRLSRRTARLEGAVKSFEQLRDLRASRK